jgi:hypothetical protein
LVESGVTEIEMILKSVTISMPEGQQKAGENAP